MATKNQSITVKGITVKVPKDVFDDIDLLEEVAEAEAGNPLRYVPILKHVFGDEQYELIKKGLADENGRTTVTAMSEFFSETAVALNALDAKN